MQHRGAAHTAASSAPLSGLLQADSRHSCMLRGHKQQKMQLAHPQRRIPRKSRKSLWKSPRARRKSCYHLQLAVSCNHHLSIRIAWQFCQNPKEML